MKCLECGTELEGLETFCNSCRLDPSVRRSRVSRESASSHSGAKHATVQPSVSETPSSSRLLPNDLGQSAQPVSRVRRYNYGPDVVAVCAVLFLVFSLIFVLYSTNTLGGTAAQAQKGQQAQ